MTETWVDFPPFVSEPFAVYVNGPTMSECASRCRLTSALGWSGAVRPEMASAAQVSPEADTAEKRLAGVLTPVRRTRR
jgi:hypothetical protein